MENKPYVSSWISELLDIYADGGEWEDYLPVLTRIDSILMRSMLSTDSELFSEEIEKEL